MNRTSSAGLRVIHAELPGISKAVATAGALRLNTGSARVFTIGLLVIVLSLAMGGCGLVDLFFPKPQLNWPSPPPEDVPRPPEARKPALSGRSYVLGGKRYHLLATADGYRAEGVASWYGRRFHRRKTASGERFNMYALTAAHKTLPMKTRVKVTNLKNDRSVIVRINDRGPFGPGRIIDLSYAAAKNLGFIKSGTVRVLVEAVAEKQQVTERSDRVAGQ